MNEEDRIVHLCVGGCYFATRRTTLLESRSFFAGALRAHAECSELFVDRDPTHFRHILNWLRGVRHVPEDAATQQELMWEADYYCMPDLSAHLASAGGVSLHREIAGVHDELRRR